MQLFWVAARSARSAGELCSLRRCAKDKTDEFMPPLIFDEAHKQRIRDGDTVLFLTSVPIARGNFHAPSSSKTSTASSEKRGQKCVTSH